MAKNKKILFPTDYSPASKAALPLAATLARQLDATLLIVHVCEFEEYPVGDLFDEGAEPDPAELKKLKAVKPADPLVKCEHRLLYGEPGDSQRVSPAEAILHLARKERPEAIVMGSHGRTGLAHLLMGGVAEAISRGAPCQVVTVRRPQRKPALAQPA